jgi:hypothetical protein
MDWVPKGGWLTKVAIDASAPQLSFDLAVDASGAGVPSWIQAGFASPALAPSDNGATATVLLAGMLAVGVLLLVLGVARPRPAASVKPQP